MPLTRDSLSDFFIQGFKKSNDLQVGVEWEKIGVYKKTLKAIRYSGTRGVEAIFKEMVRRRGWKPVKQGAHIIALEKEGSSITLEPGGQIELSGRKSKSLNNNVLEFYTHLREIKEVSGPLGIVWLGLGAQPVSSFDQVQWVPKKRYAIMRESLKNNGTLTYAMMKETASIQISLDFTSEKDAIEKLRLGFALAPFLSAMFANSPVSQGRLNGFYSRRAHIWRHTAPERTGMIPGIFDPTFNFESYIRFALAVPMLFIVRNGRWIPGNRLPFGEFLKNGLGRFRAESADWQLHLTTLFTDARLKQIVEIRSVDCQKSRLGYSVPALLKGIFYDDLSRKKAWRIVSDISLAERQRLADEVPRQGLKTRLKNKTLWEPASQLVYLAEEGLNRLVSKKLARTGEARYLIPLKELLIEKKMTPADLLMGCFKYSKNRKELLSRVLVCAAI